MRRYDPEKTVQAAALIARHHGGRISRLRLLKLLYLADRASLGASGRMITGDRIVAMENGPVLSRTYDCIKEEDFASVGWQCFLRTDGINVVVEEVAGIDRLSPENVEHLRGACEAWAHLDDWQLVEHTHDLPVWKDVYPQGQRTSVEISEEKLRAVLGLEEVAARLDAEDAATAELDRLLQSGG